jgi:hypothetical protein
MILETTILPIKLLSSKMRRKGLEPLPTEHESVELPAIQSPIQPITTEETGIEPAPRGVTNQHSTIKLLLLKKFKKFSLTNANARQ